jgi:uridine kinase
VEHSIVSHYLIVGIAGGSASGKTTLTATLAAALLEHPGCRPAVIAADKYMYRDAVRGPSFVSPSTGAVMFNANHPDSVNWEQLLSDLDVLLQQADGPNIILLEGLMVLNVPTVRERLDLRLFVELDADERALRRLLRDMNGARGMSDPAAIATYYRECARIGHAQYVEPSRAHADLIVRGDADWERLRPLLLAAITDRLAHAPSHRASLHRM